MLIINKAENVEMSRYCKRYMRVFLGIGGILFFALYSHNKISQEDIILNIQSLLSNDLVYGTYSPFRDNLYSRKEVPLPVTLSSGEPKGKVLTVEDLPVLLKVLNEFEKDETLEEFRGLLNKGLRRDIPLMHLSLLAPSNNNPIHDFLSRTVQKDTIVVIPPFDQKDGFQCGFHAVMNMLIVQQYLIGNFKETYTLKKIVSSVVESDMYLNHWLKMWGFGAIEVFLEFFVSNLQTYGDLEKYVTGLPYSAKIDYKNFNQKITLKNNLTEWLYCRAMQDLWSMVKNYFQRDQHRSYTDPFYYFKIYYGSHDKEYKKHFKQYPSARNFGSLYLREKKNGKTIRLGRDVKAIKHILDECRKKRQVIALPIIVREQQHNYALIIAQNEDGKRLYILIDSLYTESNRDKSLVKNLAEELR